MSYFFKEIKNDDAGKLSPPVGQHCTHLVFQINKSFLNSGFSYKDSLRITVSLFNKEGRVVRLLDNLSYTDFFAIAEVQGKDYTHPYFIVNVGSFYFPEDSYFDFTFSDKSGGSNVVGINNLYFFSTGSRDVSYYNKYESLKFLSKEESDIITDKLLIPFSDTLYSGSTKIELDGCPISVLYLLDLLERESTCFLSTELKDTTYRYMPYSSSNGVVSLAFDDLVSESVELVSIRKVYNRETHLSTLFDLYSARSKSNLLLSKDFQQTMTKFIYGKLSTLKTLDNLIDTFSAVRFNEQNFGYYDTVKKVEKVKAPETVEEETDMLSNVYSGVEFSSSEGQGISLKSEELDSE